MKKLYFNFGFCNPYWEGRPGGAKGVLENCRINVVETKKKFYWPKLKFRKAHRCVVTYIATDIGSFWVWDKK